MFIGPQRMSREIDAQVFTLGTEILGHRPAGAVRQFGVPADIIYLQGTLYTNITSLSSMTSKSDTSSRFASMRNANRS